MHLTTASGRVFEEPAAEQIERELRALGGGEDSFLILSRDERTFIQVAGGGGDPFTLEHQDGSLERHYRAVREVSLSVVIRVFLAYRDRGDRWRDLVEWELVDLSQPPGRRPSLVVFLVALTVVGLALAFLWWSTT